MIEFNKKSRKRNALLLSGMGMLNQIISNVAAFVYRTVFIYWLSVEYLGLNGLFSNVIQIFSLAELGIGSVIIYRLYKPIKEDNVDRTSALMHFYKRFYQFMAGIIIIVGILLSPFLPYIIHDANEIPNDVNLYTIYALYIFQSATSYMFAYRQVLLDADQKGYISTVIQMIFTCLRYGVSILVLYITRNYTLVLAMGIAVNIMGNICIYTYASYKYADVFHNNSRLTKKDILEIYKDTGSMLCHRIGSTVVNSTDNIIMSTFVGTIAVGLYSNYYMIIQIIQNVINNLLGSFTASIGNHGLSANDNERYLLYKKLRFANMWVSVFCTSSLYLLLNPFIQIVWGGHLLFSTDIVGILCLNFFLYSSRIVNGSFSNASGMFMYDRARPLIEAALNLVISIALAKKMGISGVFLGTIISSLLTVWWREPYLLYKRVFKEKVMDYFGTYIAWMMLLIIITKFLEKIFSLIPINIFGLAMRFLLCGIGINMALALLMNKNQNFRYYLYLIQETIVKRKSNTSKGVDNNE